MRAFRNYCELQNKLLDSGVRLKSIKLIVVASRRDDDRKTNTNSQVD